MSSSRAKLGHMLRAVLCASACTLACGASNEHDDGDARATPDAGSDGEAESVTCEHPCEVAIAACVERADGVSLEHASETFAGVVKAVGVAHSFELEVHCFGQEVVADSLPTVELTDEQGRAWALGFAETTVPSDYFHVGQQLTVTYEDLPACIFGGHSRALTVLDGGELAAFVMHDDKPNGLTVPGFELSVGEPLCDDDGTVSGCGFVRNSTEASAGDQVAHNACASSIGGFTLTQMYDDFRAPVSSTCDGCAQHLVAAYRER